MGIIDWTPGNGRPFEELPRETYERQEALHNPIENWILTDTIGSAQRINIFNKPYRFYRKKDLDPRRLAAILTDKVDSNRDLRDNTLGNSY